MKTKKSKPVVIQEKDIPASNEGILFETNTGQLTQWQYFKGKPHNPDYGWYDCSYERPLADEITIDKLPKNDKEFMEMCGWYELIKMLKTEIIDPELLWQHYKYYFTDDKNVLGFCSVILGSGTKYGSYYSTDMATGKRKVKPKKGDKIINYGVFPKVTPNQKKR